MDASSAAALADPAFGLIAAIMGAAGLTVLALRSNAKARAQHDPLSGLFQRDTLEDQCEAAPCYPPAPPRRGHRHRTKQLAQLWDLDSREEALERVAAVMRGSARNRSDYAATKRYLAGEGFVILDHQTAAPSTVDDAGTCDTCMFEEIRLLPAPDRAAV